MFFSTIKKLCFFILLLSQVTFSQEVKKEDSEKKDSIPKKWNTIAKLTFIFNQSSFSNWAAGGTNTVAGNVNINYEFNYKKKNWNWDNRISSAYGLSYIDKKGVRKTDDRLEYNSLLGYKSKDDWFFSFYNNLKTQYTRGYDYSKNPVLPISDLFSPAYISFGPGMLWKKSENKFINIAPSSSRFTFVSEEFSGKYGVDEGKTSNFGLGFNLSSYYKFSITETLTMENILALYADYLDNPQNIDVDYQVNFMVKISDLFTTNLGFHTIIDDNASSRIQFRQLFGLGINYVIL